MPTSQGLNCPLCHAGLRVDTYTTERNSETWWTCVSCGTVFKYPQWKEVGSTLWPVEVDPQDSQMMTLAEAEALLAGIRQCRVNGHSLTESYATLHRNYGGIRATSIALTPRTIHVYRCTRCNEKFIREGYTLSVTL